MQSLTIHLISQLNETYESIFAPFDTYIESLGMQSWATGAIIDCVHMLPFLYVVFLFIEFIEFKYSNKIAHISKYSGKTGPILGSLVATFPQCGFSVIASTLYAKRYITIGTLLAIYIATSDEAIPIILSNPDKISLLIPLVLTKIAIAIIFGYLIDIFIGNQSKDITEYSQQEIEEKGCCKHNISKATVKDLFIHPITHTFNIFFFIFFITLGINYLIVIAGGPDQIGKYFLNDKLIQPVVTAIVGLIPNCAISVALTTLYLKGAIGFGSVISGLSSGAGLGLIVLFKKNKPLTNSIKIVLILLCISMLSGILIQLFCQ